MRPFTGPALAVIAPITLAPRAPDAVRSSTTPRIGSTTDRRMVIVTTNEPRAAARIGSADPAARLDITATSTYHLGLPFHG